MTFAFQKAVKQATFLRCALIGPAGSGKTFSALSIATAMGGRIGVIDTEHGSAKKYADKFSFEVLELTSFAPRTYVEAIAAAEAAGFDTLIIDSLSHAWSGKDGALEMVDRRAAQSQSKNSFDAWRQVTPEHNKLVEALLSTRCHLFITLRTKTEYVVEENASGKKVPRKVGLAPVQRDGLEYEFDVVCDMNLDHQAVISKTRCSDLADQVIDRPGAALAKTLRTWLAGDGPARVAAPRAPDPANDDGDGDAPPAPVAPARSIQLASFLERVRAVELPGAAVALWISGRADLAPLHAAEREAAWKALCLRTAEVGRMQNARDWLKHEIGEEDRRRVAVPEPASQEAPAAAEPPAQVVTPATATTAVDAPRKVTVLPGGSTIEYHDDPAPAQPHAAPATDPAPVQASVAPAAPAPTDAEGPGPVEQLLGEIASLASPEDAVTCWIDWRRTLADWPEESKRLAWDAIGRRVEALGRKPGKTWLKQAVSARDKPTPPKGPGGGAPKPTAGASTAAQGTAAPVATPPAAPAALHRDEVITSEGEVLDTEDAMRAHLAGLDRLPAVQGSYTRHHGESARYSRLCAERFAALAGTDTECAAKSLEDSRKAALKRAA